VHHGAKISKQAPPYLLTFMIIFASAFL